MASHLDLAHLAIQPGGHRAATWARERKSLETGPRARSWSGPQGYAGGMVMTRTGSILPAPQHGLSGTARGRVSEDRPADRDPAPR